MREIEGRRLNLMVFNLPESKKDDVKDRQLEDTEFLQNLLEQNMNLDLSELEVVKPVRVGRRELVNGEIKKVKNYSQRFFCKKKHSEGKYIFTPKVRMKYLVRFTSFLISLRIRGRRPSN